MLSYHNDADLKSKNAIKTGSWDETAAQGAAYQKYANELIRLLKGESR